NKHQRPKTTRTPRTAPSGRLRHTTRAFELATQMAAPRRFGSQHAPGYQPLVECGWKRGGAVFLSSVVETGPIGPPEFGSCLTGRGLLMEVVLASFRARNA